MLGGYQLFKRLALGGTAEVWLARSSITSQLVVIKSILSHLVDEPEFLRMFKAEASLVSSLKHPNIVQCFELSQGQGRTFIAMEFVLGRTLRQIQQVLFDQHKLMPRWFVLRVALDLCEALEHAHTQRDGDGRLLGIVHRDITPENVIVSFSGVTKVLDFGIAKATHDMTPPGGSQIKGKLAYLAPEQIIVEGGTPVDQRTDIYGTGALLYEMMTGLQPFRAANDMALLLRIPRDTPPPASEIAPWVPSKLGVVVMKALAKRPEDRFQSAGELGEELTACLRAEGTDATEQRVAEFMRSLFSKEDRRPPDISYDSITS